jgi:hypothetical protein
MVAIGNGNGQEEIEAAEDSILLLFLSKKSGTTPRGHPGEFEFSGSLAGGFPLKISLTRKFLRLETGARPSKNVQIDSYLWAHMASLNGQSARFVVAWHDRASQKITRKLSNAPCISPSLFGLPHQLRQQDSHQPWRRSHLAPGTASRRYESHKGRGKLFMHLEKKMGS